MTSTAGPGPLMCDMTMAPDSPQERLAEWARIFDHALAGRERTAAAVIWRFTARAGVEEWARDLAEREAACCPFLTFTVTAREGQVIFRIDGDTDPMVQAALDEIHDLPGAGFTIRTSDDDATTASTRP